MSRELKFRAWDRVNNEWYLESDDNSLTYYGFHIFGECTLLCTPRGSDLPNLEISQFTGLTDKNGVEIYEGDILKRSEHLGGNFIDTLIDILVVEWKGYGFTLSHVPKRMYSTDLDNCIDYEVIGNIHENPELLTTNIGNEDG